MALVVEETQVIANEQTAELHCIGIARTMADDAARETPHRVVKAVGCKRGPQSSSQSSAHARP